MAGPYSWAKTHRQSGSRRTCATPRTVEKRQKETCSNGCAPRHSAISSPVLDGPSSIAAPASCKTAKGMSRERLTGEPNGEQNPACHRLGTVALCDGIGAVVVDD